MKVFTIKVTSCRNCPYMSQKCYPWAECGHPAARLQGTGNCMMIYDQNEFEITPSCPMYNKAIEQ